MEKKPSFHFIKKKTKLAEKPSLIDNDITEISQRILMELETASSKDLSEAKYAKKILQLSDLDYTKNLFHEIESVPSGPERVIEKRAVIQALLLSTWLQRLYFIIRSALNVGLRSGRYILLCVVLRSNRCCPGSCHGRSDIYYWVDCNQII